jgi:cation transport regulator ChaC
MLQPPTARWFLTIGHVALLLLFASSTESFVLSNHYQVKRRRRTSFVMFTPEFEQAPGEVLALRKIRKAKRSTGNYVPDSDEPLQATWDPVSQVYVGGKLPENGGEVEEMIRENDGWLRIFGYGSLCWNAGTPGESALTDDAVTSTTGQARGYRRVWAQKSTDHRGTPAFPGLVCTLLTDSEFLHLVGTTRPTSNNPNDKESLTEGVIYCVPPELTSKCLEELDFREKGVSVRDVCQDTTLERAMADI